MREASARARSESAIFFTSFLLFSSLFPPFLPTRIDADVHLVAPTSEAFDDVSLQVEIFKLDPYDLAAEPVPVLATPATFEVEDKDHWPAIDGVAGSPDRADAGVGGLVSVRAIDMTAQELPPALWSAEEPNLYVLVLTLLEGKKDKAVVLEAEASLVGLRKVEIRDRQLQVNRKPIMIKGANRHEHDERRGKACTEEGMLQDVLLLKKFNFNAVRCSHYPNIVQW